MQRSNAQSTDVIETVDRGTQAFEPATGVGLGGAKGEPQRTATVRAGTRVPAR